MVDHTPLPWKVERDQHFGPGFVITADGMQNRCPVVRMTSPLGDEDKTLKGDAELIVKAVNNHEALVKALSDIAYSDSSHDAVDLRRRAKAALLGAEGVADAK